MLPIPKYLVCLLSSWLLGGCATPTPQDVGAVVRQPPIQVPPEPALVTEAEPKPTGYYQCSFLNYFWLDCSKPTQATQPTPAAERTPGS